MLAVGDTISLGLYATNAGAPVKLEWLVVNVQDNQARIVIKKPDLFMYVFGDDAQKIWKDSQLRIWLNNDVYESIFSQKEKMCIADSIVKDDEQFKVSYDEEGGTWLRESYPVKVQPVITRDKLSIPRMSEIAVFKKVKTYDGQVMAYAIRKEYSELINEIWGQYNEFMILDMCQCERKYWSTGELVSQGLYHGTFLWKYNSDDPDNPEMRSERLLGYCSGSISVPVAIAAWIDINEYENM